MTNPLEAQHLIDNIDDAEADLKRYRKQLWCIGTGEVTGALLVLFGVVLGLWSKWHHCDIGIYVGIMDTAGVITIVLTSIMLAIIKEDLEVSPHRELVQARRKYRDHLARTSGMN
jgi:hypothetical protein